MIYHEEKWKKWYPLEHLRGIEQAHYYIELINSNKNGFTCTLGHYSKIGLKLELDFGPHVIAYQYIRESFRLRTQYENFDGVDPQQDNKKISKLDAALNHDFFTSEDSALLNGIKKYAESTIRDKLVQYTFFEADFCLDIIASKSPIVRVIE